MNNLENLDKFKRGPKVLNRIAHERAVERYYKNPSYCLFCKKLLELDGKKNVFYFKSIKKYCDKTCYGKHKKLLTAELHKGDRKKILVTLGPFKTKKECNPAQICYHAKKVYYSKFKNPKCEICGYDKLLDVAHIQAVSTFSEDTLLLLINNLGNIIGLCPNHHREYDNGLLDKEIIQQAINLRQL